VFVPNTRVSKIRNGESAKENREKKALTAYIIMQQVVFGLQGTEKALEIGHSEDASYFNSLENTKMEEAPEGQMQEAPDVEMGDAGGAACGNEQGDGAGIFPQTDEEASAVEAFIAVVNEMDCDDDDSDPDEASGIETVTLDEDDINSDDDDSDPDDHESDDMSVLWQTSFGVRER